MVFPTDLRRFTDTLKERLGPQIQNIHLLYQGTPDLKGVLDKANITSETPKEHLATGELRARFQSLVENVFTVIAETRLFALFLDDLHEADESFVLSLLDCEPFIDLCCSTMDLVSALLNSRSRMVSRTMKHFCPLLKVSAVNLRNVAIG